MKQVVLCNPVRTVSEACNGSLQGLAAADPGAAAIRAVVRHAGVERMNTRLALGFVCLLLAAPSFAGPWRAAAANTYGWQFMTPDERIEHQRRMRSFSSYEDCKTYQAEHHARMAERARQSDVVLQGRDQSGCEQLRARGKLR